MEATSRIEKTIAVSVLALITVGCLVVLSPFMSALLWAAVLCYCTWPAFARLDRLFRQRRSLAAATMTLIITCVLVVPFVMVGVTLAENVSRVVDLVHALRRNVTPEAPEWVRNLPWVGDALAHYWANLAEDTERVTRLATQSALQGGSWLVRHSLDLGQGIIQLVLSVFIAYFFYRDGDRVVARIVAGGRRIAGDQTQYVLGVVGHTVRGVVYGVIGTAMAQGILAGFGFWIADVPSPLLLGLLTFVLSSILLGAPIVWVPVVVWLFAERSIGWGVFMGVWGTFVVSGVDNLIRPYLISRGAGLPFIIIFLGGIGGLLAFGLIGIFLGPTLLAVGHSLIKEFSDGTAAGGGAGRRFGRRRARPGGEGGTGDGRQEDDGTGRDSAAGH